MFSLGKICSGLGSAAATVIFGLALTPTGVAAAAGPAVLGPGSGIAIGTSEPEEFSLCTLTAIGFDAANRLVGITAGHCGEVGAQVLAEKSIGTGFLGRLAELDYFWDWAVIEFDPAKVIPVRQITAGAVAGIGAPPAPLQMVCKNGRTTGFTCGPVWEEMAEGFSSHVCADYGDSGSPVLVGDQLVGMIVSGQPIDLGSVDLHLPSCANPANPVHEPDLATGIANVLASINQHGGVGAGFRLL
ncbi:S1 family peptidase [Nocardia sp. NBC_01503]|uniref:peptidase S1 n=1 Tax=Nocardia sp. NBC_01503 TaxID=2975997 RepID=UPI002E7C53CC|nr:peptidase S1 [Nocardia sp. NBC_01503]WTL30246.1 S1 family peptidase [Nocardia sp. NBC_01503]